MPVQIESVYRYPLPCGHTHHSSSRSLCVDCREWGPIDVDDTDDDKLHWFACRRCPLGIYGFTHDEARSMELRPRFTSDRFIPDLIIAQRVDAALFRARVLHELRVWQGIKPVALIARECGVTPDYVRRLAKQAGFDTYVSCE